MRDDILRVYPQVDPAKVHVVHNGIDLEGWRRPEGEADRVVADRVVRDLGIDPERPAVVFVGRITRQKGLPYLRARARALPEVQVRRAVRGRPRHPEIAAEVSGAVEVLQSERTGVVWIEQMLPRAELVAVLAASTVFVCPSVYEPLGIVNLEAMAVGLPVVGTATGGIPEVVDDGVTGLLVPIDQADDGTGTPLDPDRFVADLADALTQAWPPTPRAPPRWDARRARVEEHFAWAIGERTLEVYRTVLGQS